MLWVFCTQSMKQRPTDTRACSVHLGLRFLLKGLLRNPEERAEVTSGCCTAPSVVHATVRASDYGFLFCYDFTPSVVRMAKGLH